MAKGDKSLFGVKILFTYGMLLTELTTVFATNLQNQCIEHFKTHLTIDSLIMSIFFFNGFIDDEDNFLFFFSSSNNYPYQLQSLKSIKNPVLGFESPLI